MDTKEGLVQNKIESIPKKVTPWRPCQLKCSFWPISMLGMFLIGIRIAVAGRWTGLSRFYPLVAESWAVVTVPTMGIFGEGVARWVGAAHLVIGYAVLGQVVARKKADGS